MEPALLARELRRIATAINNSENPSRKLVYQDIKRLIHTLATEGGDKTPAGEGTPVSEPEDRFEAATKVYNEINKAMNRMNATQIKLVVGVLEEMDKIKSASDLQKLLNKLIVTQKSKVAGV